MARTDEITMVVRSAGERTLDACVKLLKEIIPPEQIKVINEVPFSKALLKSLEIGLEEKRPWLACIDADVLVDKKGVMELFHKTEQVPQEVFEIQGLILDKFFPVFRPAGNHLYRLKFIETAIGFLKKSDPNLIRPEASLLTSMAKKGYPWFQSDIVIGIHDFEQYYADIFRKCYFHGKKHKAWMPFVYLDWFEKGKSDPDFQVAFAGVFSGLIHSIDPKVERSLITNKGMESLEKLGLEEKKEFSKEIKKWVEDQINVGRNKINKNLQNLTYPPNELNKVNRLFEKENKNIFSNPLENAAGFFEKVGGKLRYYNKQMNK